MLHCDLVAYILAEYKQMYYLRWTKHNRMKTKASEPTVTTKYHIVVPTHQFESIPTLFKVYFGKKYLIWKGKSLLQSCQFLAEGIERFIRLQKTDDTDYLYHVCNHIKKTRCIQATVEVIDNSFMRTRNGSESINGYAMLVEEQKLLDRAKNDLLCLNNNLEAYVPNWVTVAHKDKFAEYLKKKKRK